MRRNVVPDQSRKVILQDIVGMQEKWMLLMKYEAVFASLSMSNRWQFRYLCLVVRVSQDKKWNVEMC